MPQIEVGILSNPIVFTGVIAGQVTLHPSNPFILWNDKGGIQQSADAKNITFQVLELNITDELVGFGTGNPDQTFTVGFPPVVSADPFNPLAVKVNGVAWLLVSSFTPFNPTDQVFTFDFTTGIVTFGDGIHGAIPSVGNTIEVSYTPNTVDYGTEISNFNWLGVRSFGVISNSVSIVNERELTTDATHIGVAHRNLVSVTGVFLNTDSGHFGTNYYTGGSFNSLTGVITLGTPVASANIPLLVTYTYTIIDDLEADFTQIGENTTHTLQNDIPSNNAKLLYLQMQPPAITSPSGLLNLSFRIRITYGA
jgi:hypothetical protein